jgi:hypothetical protein
MLRITPQETLSTLDSLDIRLSRLFTKVSTIKLMESVRRFLRMTSFIYVAILPPESSIFFFLLSDNGHTTRDRPLVLTNR